MQTDVAVPDPARDAAAVAFVHAPAQRVIREAHHLGQVAGATYISPNTTKSKSSMSVDASILGKAETFCNRSSYPLFLGVDPV